MNQQTNVSGHDVVELLTLEHREMEDLVGQIQRTPDAEQRRELTDTLIAEVMRHAVAEEMYVYPVMEKRIPKGTEEVEHDKEEHEEIIQLMKQLEDADAAEPAFMDRLHELEELLRHHHKDEEVDQFSLLHEHLDASELVDLGKKVEYGKKLAPTRPHPGAPHSELFHKTIGPGVGMIDRLRDKLSGRMTG
ncbi:hemerythrin domain-containing protein [Billgrantia kenyensis]|uniref:Hemerythrin domain-containing protein n=1 Tax=Billgrantia kenyensis TaxID=321266 RepID=A0A7V9W003_9GAMM|nr:hemerythrin domain-containing protein [Halomonas kenyensis]MBA2778529.1 hemerythrin domain-containing protein [Halomonas kenyensis]MCG6661666.1 hemerythrin domain-containing protein [Halomonas kenyensis]